MSSMLFTHGPADIPQLDQWFVLTEERVFPEGQSILRLIERRPELEDAHRYTHWSLLSDREREQICQTVAWPHAVGQ